VSTKKSVDLTQGPVHRHVLRMVGPFWFAILALMSASVVDTIYLGHLSTEALATMGFCGPIVFLGNSVNIGLGAGTLSAISRDLGRKDINEAKRHGVSAILLSIVIMLIVNMLGMIGLSLLLTKMGANADVKPLAMGYLKYAMPALVFMGIGMMCNNTLRASGEAALPSMIMIIGAAINIVIDPLLIFGIGPFPRMEVEGAALGTLISSLFTAGLGLYLVFVHRKAASFKGLAVGTIMKGWKIIGRVGFPAMGTNVIVPLSGLAAMTIVARNLGTNEEAAFTLVTRVGMLSLTLLYALSACIGAITGQNGGAGHTERVRATFVFCFKICFAWGAFIGIILGGFSRYIPWAFTKDAAVVDIAQPYFWIVPITFAFYGLVFVSAAGFNALGRPSYGMAFTVIRSVILFVPFIWLGVMLSGMNGVFIAIAAANVISGIIAMAYTLRRAPMTVAVH